VEDALEHVGVPALFSVNRATFLGPDEQRVSLELSGVPTRTGQLELPDQAGSARKQSHVVRGGDKCAYGCAYRLVSATCSLLQFVAETIPARCSMYPFQAARFSPSSRTFNPKVAGSIPARPTHKPPVSRGFLFSQLPDQKT
jgi:hypothetical protein